MSHLRGHSSLRVAYIGSLVFLILLPSCCHADFDVNAVVGVVTVGGVPAAKGSLVGILDHESGFTFTTKVDGENIPPFLKGQGRYDTGDVPAFSTGDSVTVFLLDMPEKSSISIVLQGGTNVVDLSLGGDSELRAVSGPSSQGSALPDSTDQGQDEPVPARSSLLLGSVERWTPGWFQSLAPVFAPAILAAVALVLLVSASHLALARRRAASTSRPARQDEVLETDSDSC